MLENVIMRHEVQAGKQALRGERPTAVFPYSIPNVRQPLLHPHEDIEKERRHGMHSLLQRWGQCKNTVSI